MQHIEEGRAGANAIRQRLGEERDSRTTLASDSQKAYRQHMLDDLKRWEVHILNIAFHMLELREVLVEHVESARGNVNRYIDPQITEVFDWVDRGSCVVGILTDILLVLAWQG